MFVNLIFLKLAIYFPTYSALITFLFKTFCVTHILGHDKGSLKEITQYFDN